MRDWRVTLELVLLAFVAGWLCKWAHGYTGPQTRWDLLVIGFGVGIPLAIGLVSDRRRRELILRRPPQWLRDLVGRLEREGMPRVAVTCDCSCGAPCPQGRVGSETRCTIWKAGNSPERA